tara:strand:- start:334 stop:747 length:414 start_codon:yes stop_codon:yes gene_type:complete
VGRKKERRENQSIKFYLEGSSPSFFVCVCSLLSLFSEKKNNRSLLSGEFKRGLLHICTRVLLNTHTHLKAHYSRLNMSFASTIANRAALATRVVSQVTKSSNNKRRSLIVKAEGDVPAETEKPAAAAPAVRFFTSSL